MQIRKKLAGFTTVSVLGSVFLAWTTIHVPFAHVASASGALAFDYSPVGDSKFSNHTMFCSQLSVMHRTMHLRDIFELIRDTFLERFQSCPAQFAHDDVLWRWITHLLGAWVANEAAVSGEEIDLRSVALFGSTFVYPRGGGNSVVHGAVWHLMMSASSDDQLILLGSTCATPGMTNSNKWNLTWTTNAIMEWDMDLCYSRSTRLSQIIRRVLN